MSILRLSREILKFFFEFLFTVLRQPAVRTHNPGDGLQKYDAEQENDRSYN